jgi:hypothetical protein
MSRPGGEKGRDSMAQWNSSEVVKKIYFFRVDVGKTDAGKLAEFDPKPILKALNKLGFKDGERYVDNGDGNSTCAWVDNAASEPKMRLATIRKTDLPQFEVGGELDDLELPENGGLAEPMHMIFFPNNIVGAEFNFYGPRATRLPWYLKQALPVEAASINRIEFLTRQDVLGQLGQFETIRTVSLTARPAYSATLQTEISDLAAALDAAANIGGSETISLSLSVGRSRTGKLQNILQGIKNLVKKKKIPIELVSRFDVSGLNAETGRVESVDLLQDYLVAEQRVLKVDPKMRALDRESVYKGIRDAYARLKSEIASALAVW